MAEKNPEELGSGEQDRVWLPQAHTGSSVTVTETPAPHAGETVLWFFHPLKVPITIGGEF